MMLSSIDFDHYPVPMYRREHKTWLKIYLFRHKECFILVRGRKDGAVGTKRIYIYIWDFIPFSSCHIFSCWTKLWHVLLYTVSIIPCFIQSKLLVSIILVLLVLLCLYSLFLLWRFIMSNLRGASHVDWRRNYGTCVLKPKLKQQQCVKVYLMLLCMKVTNGRVSHLKYH